MSAPVQRKRNTGADSACFPLNKWRERPRREVMEGWARQTEKSWSQGSGGVYITALGAFEIYSVWSLALNADIKIITAVC